ncbi:hypothetical protein NE237_027520 [Protea cynaroides]|uniref:Calcineurin-like phosphoesterase domain-containing protein n=1 Tax=Protea cynaroides TaxID=273540 RepID=A0A9Q0JUG7_9MAGN|nr:hypothetical protein NE237_027520 [Protea cynaroides]
MILIRRLQSEASNRWVSTGDGTRGQTQTPEGYGAMFRTWLRMNVPPSCYLFASSPSCSSSSASSSISSSPSKQFNHHVMATSIRIAIVGDVHDDWHLQEDEKALQFLKPDLVLFTGDFGNENVELVRSVADLKMAKAVILGNHDAWNTKQFSQKRKDPVQLQMECLSEEHVGYHRLDFPMLKLSVLGGRPFSGGGDRLFRKRLLSARYGVNDMDGSSKKIYRSASGTPEDHSIIILAHNGPTGLGSKMDDICGRDWVFVGGDHGDPDLAQAISELKETTQFSIPLVVFGHMHKELAYDGLRKMIVVGADNTIYLNGAIVPRVKRLIGEQGNSSNSMTDEIALRAPESEGTLRAFTVADILDGKLEKIAETWVSVIGDKMAVEEEHVLFKSGT